MFRHKGKLRARRTNFTEITCGSYSSGLYSIGMIIFFRLEINPENICHRDLLTLKIW